MANRYFLDRFDADGKLYIFDAELAGSEVCGPMPEGTGEVCVNTLNEGGITPELLQAAIERELASSSG